MRLALAVLVDCLQEKIEIRIGDFDVIGLMRELVDGALTLLGSAFKPGLRWLLAEDVFVDLVRRQSHNNTS